ncbi:MAG: hypothetical protein SPK09_06955 [Porphyromonas sp.]|nr:hypothetical protein [Porphyromonas sp.]
MIYTTNWIERLNQKYKYVLACMRLYRVLRLYS